MSSVPAFYLLNSAASQFSVNVVLFVLLSGSYRFVQPLYAVVSELLVHVKLFMQVCYARTVMFLCFLSCSASEHLLSNEGD